MNTIKKHLFPFICIAIICTFGLHGFAAEYSGPSSDISVDGSEKCFIRNEYYTIYADALFEYSYTQYKKDLSETEGQDGLLLIADGQKIDPALYEQMQEEGDRYYLSLYLQYEGEFTEEANRKILSSLDGLSEILYVGTATPCAVVAVPSGQSLDAVLNHENVACVTRCFSSIRKTVPAIPEDGNIVYAPTAADARLVLRYSAGLETIPSAQLSEAKKFFFLNDCDLDGKLTAADARTALRISAGLEAQRIFSVSTESFWEF